MRILWATVLAAAVILASAAADMQSAQADGGPRIAKYSGSSGYRNCCVKVVRTVSVVPYVRYVSRTTVVPRYRTVTHRRVIHHQHTVVHRHITVQRHNVINKHVITHRVKTDRRYSTRHVHQYQTRQVAGARRTVVVQRGSAPACCR